MFADRLLATGVREHLDIMENVFHDARTGKKVMMLRGACFQVVIVDETIRTRTLAAVGVFAKLG